MEPTPQFLILTEHEKILDVEEKKLKPNPFYKKDLEHVLRNLDRAMEIYKILFDQFLSVWYFTYQNGWIPEDWKFRNEWETLELQGGPYVF